MLHSIGFGSLFEIFDLVNELTDVLKMTVNGGVPHVGNRVYQVQLLHHFSSDFARMDLAAIIRFQVLHDVLNRLFERIQTDRTLLARFDDPLA